MIHDSKDKIYDLNLISKIKKQTGERGLKKISKHLRSHTRLDVKDFNELKVKIFNGDAEEIKNIEEKKKAEFKISAPILNLTIYTKYLKKLSSKIYKNYKEDDDEEERMPPTVADNDEEIVQIESSDFSVDD